MLDCNNLWVGVVSATTGLGNWLLVENLLSSIFRAKIRIVTEATTSQLVANHSNVDIDVIVIVRVLLYDILVMEDCFGIARLVSLRHWNVFTLVYGEMFVALTIQESAIELQELVEVIALRRGLVAGEFVPDEAQVVGEWDKVLSVQVNMTIEKFVWIVVLKEVTATPVEEVFV
jgi:hypothetical protein